ncbi:MAG: YfcE family phosphodiesterase [Halobacteria archaeon]|nr:YfcE family phosphodiesterase [Candidatus Bathyarchaeota archaeon]
MEVLVIADIHANIVALDAVLKRVGPVDIILHAGDIVDYNPWPREAIAKVKMLNIKSTMGNHDRDSAMNTPYGYNPLAQISCRWTYNQLTFVDRQFLLNLPKSLKLTVEGLKLFICHGSPRDLVDEYIFPDTPQEILKQLLEMTGADILVLGHTHIPFLTQVGDNQYILNPGGVGQPRDGDSRASCMILNINRGVVSIEHIRVEYDIDKVSNAIIDAKLPKALAERLYFGY